MSILAQTTLTTPERRLISRLVLGQTLAQAAPSLSLDPAEAEALLANLMRRHGLSARHQLLVRALLYRWI